MEAVEVPNPKVGEMCNLRDLQLIIPVRLEAIDASLRRHIWLAGLYWLNLL